jgi:hypothetical protein
MLWQLSVELTASARALALTKAGVNTGLTQLEPGRSGAARGSQYLLAEQGRAVDCRRSCLFGLFGGGSVGAAARPFPLSHSFRNLLKELLPAFPSPP